MTQRQKELINCLANEGYEFRTGQYIQEGFAIYKKNASSFIGFLLVTTAIYVICGITPAFIGSVLYSIILSPVLSVGNYIVSHKISKRQHTEFGDFFKGFNYLPQLVLLNLAITVIFIILFSPTIIEMYQSGIVDWYLDFLKNPLEPPTDLPPVSEKTGMIILLNLIPVIYLSNAYSWASLFVVFHDMNFWEALESSRKVISKRWLTVFMLFLTLFSFVLVAYVPTTIVTIASPAIGVFLMMAFVIALICLSPAFYAILYVSFASVTELHEAEDEDEDEDIFNHFIE